MAKYTMDMVLEYAKVFKENADMGNPDGNRVAQAVAQKGGQYVVNAYFTEQDQIDQLLADGLDPNPMNSDRIIQGNQDYGIGMYMKLKRPVPDNIKTFENKNGKVDVNYGGPVGVVNLTEGAENKRWWSFEDDGPLGNGTRAKVQFETYSKGAGVRLINLGVTDHIPYEDTYVSNPDDELFNMDAA